MSTDWSKYNDFIEDAERDDRVGSQEFLVSSVTDGVWEKSGEPYREYSGVLTSANNASFDFRLSPINDAEVLDKEKVKAMDSNRKKAIRTSITLNRTLAEHYGKAYNEVSSGDKLKVELVKNKQGFIRAVAFLAKDHAVGSANGSQPETASAVPF